MLNKFKKLNKKTTSGFINTQKYWNISPPGMLLYKATDLALSEYAHGKVVLDAGAGRLAYKKLIKKYAKKYISADFKKTHPELDYIVDIEKLSTKVNRVDVVFCSQVLEHVPHPWIAMKEINKTLKKGGNAIITVPHLAYLHNLPYDFYRYTEYGLISLSEYAGFEVIKIKPLGGLFCFLGYIRSGVIKPLLGIKVIGNLLFIINKALSKADIALDSILQTPKLFPLNYLLIVKKS